MAFKGREATVAPHIVTESCQVANLDKPEGRVGRSGVNGDGEKDVSDSGRGLG